MKEFEVTHKGEMGEESSPIWGISLHDAEAIARYMYGDLVVSVRAIA